MARTPYWRIVHETNGRIVARNRLKEIERCPSCKKRLFLEDVVENGDTRREVVHRNESEAAVCEVKMFPPWEIPPEPKGLKGFWYRVKERRDSKRVGLR